LKKKTLQAFDEWKKDPLSVTVLVQRVAEGGTLKAYCTSIGVPYSLVAQYVAQTPAVKSQYDAALQMWGDSLAQETVGIADKADAETIGASKLQVETRLKLAGKIDRERYGEREAPKVQVNIALGDVAREIALLEQRLGIASGAPAVLPAVVVNAEPAEAPI
jgi:hypothetical protein